MQEESKERGEGEREREREREREEPISNVKASSTRVQTALSSLASSTRQIQIGQRNAEMPTDCAFRSNRSFELDLAARRRSLSKYRHEIKGEG